MEWTPNFPGIFNFSENLHLEKLPTCSGKIFNYPIAVNCFFSLYFNIFLKILNGFHWVKQKNFFLLKAVFFINPMFFHPHILWSFLLAVVWFHNLLDSSTSGSRLECSPRIWGKSKKGLGKNPPTLEDFSPAFYLHSWCQVLTLT
jgi:hypothetical protein